MKEALLILVDFSPLLVAVAYGIALYKIGKVLNAQNEKLLKQSYPQAGKPNYTKHVDWLLEREGS